METERKGDSNLGTYALLTFYRYGTIHHIYDIFRNRHSQAGSLYFTDGTAVFPLKRFKNMGNKFLTHTDTGIFNTEIIVCVTCRRSRLLYNPNTDNTARSRIFHSITEQIEEYLIQTQFVPINIFIQNIHCIDIQLKLLCANIRLQNIAQPMQNVGQTTLLFLQAHLPAFNTAHIQHIIDQTQQVIT